MELVVSYDDNGSMKFYYIKNTETSMPMHTGYFGTRKEANAALKKIAQGITVKGDIKEG